MSRAEFVATPAIAGDIYDATQAGDWQRGEQLSLGALNRAPRATSRSFTELWAP